MVRLFCNEIVLLVLFFVFVFAFRAAPAAYGVSQVRGQIGVVALAYARATAMLDLS